MSHLLTEKAMVMNFSSGIWQGYRLDRDASRKVTDDAGAAADAARVNKHLIPKESLAPIVTAQGAIRAHFYANTLPWRDNGDRLMPRVQYLKFIPEHERLVGIFNMEVEDFLTGGYPSAIEKAEFRMGAMFKREDYPAVSELRRKFYANLDVDAVTDVNDFRVALDAQNLEKIRATITASAETRLQAAMADVWKRMAETVSYFQQRMADPTAVFRDTTVTNISDMLDLVPGLNVLDDPQIEQVRKMIAESLGGVDAKSIRKDGALRSQLAGEAGKIMSTMESFMRAFGAGPV
jgi:hypothetical protein